MKNRRLIFAMLVILVAGCAKENELKKSVLIYDSEYTDLPAYTEWGYNTFGAYYDRQIFISNNETVPAKVIVSKGRMSFVLGGQNGITKYYSDPFKKMTMTFELAGFTPGTYTNLIVLNDTILDLTNSAVHVFASIDTTQYSAAILSGALAFKKAQNLQVDKVQIEVILSGYFEFKALIQGNPVTVSNGRFDVGIGPDNFYNY